MDNLLTNTQECPMQANWWDLKLSMNWCYEGSPNPPKLTSEGVYLVAWLLLEGSVVVDSEGETTYAEKGQWVISRPSKRTHNFSDSARIISLHFSIECPGLITAWSGPAMVVLADTPPLRRHATRLQRLTALRHLPQKARFNLIGMPTSLEDALELREAVTAFLRRLFALVAPLGMRFGPSAIQDQRVQASYRHLMQSNLREGFSRTALARSCGLSPSQLDRLWRSEFGTTPQQYWTRRRLEEACFRLRNESTSIKALAYDLGFSHLTRFSIWFRQLQGLSPWSYRHHHPGV